MVTLKRMLGKGFINMVKNKESMSKPRISIIIPVYNSEPYLSKCLNSVVNQTFKDIEIIVVNDCSPDNSEKIINDYLKNDDRIVYIKHVRNLGLGGVRNTGIMAARGEYQWHIDSDDFIDINACEFLWGVVQENKNNALDIVCFSAFNYRIVNGNAVISRDKIFFRDRDIVSKVMTGPEIFKKIYEIRNGFPCAMWLNFFRTDFIQKLYQKGIKVIEHTAHQDTDFVPIVYHEAETVLCLHYTPYYRLIHGSATTAKAISYKSIKDKLVVSLSLYKYLSAQNYNTADTLYKFASKDFKNYLRIYYHNLELDTDKKLFDLINDINKYRNRIILNKKEGVKPKVSIIVPVYGTEVYLGRCLDSIINQTMSDIEIIVVNDCSPDNSEEIIFEYMSRDPRIIYLKHEQNLRQGGARNTGLTYAKGDYIGFVDSDDWIKSEMYEKLYAEAEQTNSDMVICSIAQVNERKEKRIIGNNERKVIDNDNKEFFNDLSNTISACNRIYRKDLIEKNEIKFPTKVRAEDQVFMLEVAFLTKRVCIVPEALFFYEHRDKSDVNSRKTALRNQDIGSLERVIIDFNHINHCLWDLRTKHPDIINFEAYKKRIFRWVSYSSIKELLLKIVFLYEDTVDRRKIISYWKEYFIDKAFIGGHLFAKPIFSDCGDSYQFVKDVYRYLDTIAVFLEMQDKDQQVLEELVQIFKKTETEIDLPQKQVLRDAIKPYADALDIKKRTPRLIFNQRVNIKRITPVFEHFFFGYYDLRTMNANENEHLALKVPFIDKLPGKNDKAAVCIIKENGSIKQLDETYAWNFQQGAHLQYRPGYENQVIYNIYDRADGLYKAVIYDLKTAEKKHLPLPVANVSPNGDKALSLNFSRLHDYRPGYGYCHKKDPHFDEVKPQYDGVFSIDLDSGKYELIISYQQLWDMFAKGTKNEKDKLVVNHVCINPEGSRFLMLLRFFSNTAPWPTLTLTADLNGENIHKIFGFGSHYHWKDSRHLVVTGINTHDKPEKFHTTAYEIEDITGNYKPIDRDFFNDDGHCSYSPERKYMLYDSYASRKFPYRKLMIYDLENGKGTNLAYLYANPDLYNNIKDCRCDLHPRWSPQGNYITFDSIHEGFRGIYCIDASEAIKEIDKEIDLLSEADIQVLINTGIGGKKELKKAKNSKSKTVRIKKAIATLFPFLPKLKTRLMKRKLPRQDKKGEIKKNAGLKVGLKLLIHKILLKISPTFRKQHAIEKKLKAMGNKLESKANILESKANKLESKANVNEASMKKLLQMLDQNKKAIKDYIEALREIEARHNKIHEKTNKEFNVIKSDLNIIFKYLSQGIELHPYNRRESYVLVTDYRFVYELYRAAIARYEFAASYIEKDDLILDISCGYGYGSSYIMDNTPAKKVLGADVFKPAVDYAKKVFKENDLIDFAHADITDETSFAEGSFDKIISIETIEHVEDDCGSIRSVFKWLKKNGLLICSVPNQNVYPLDKEKEPYHFKHYTTSEIKTLLEDAGFTIVDIIYENEDKENVQFSRETEQMRIIVIARK